ncbi:MAG: gamma carbonic anhydrase family protein [Thermoplasmata archaeon]|nr:MAG: gamma carbonic anhydrase family protein [Thermoplasmata archaeon]
MKDDFVKPVLGKNCYIHPSAVLTGDVRTGEECSFWPNSSVRGDEDSIRLGRRVNVQDGAVIHVDVGTPVVVGDDVSIGHGAVVHGCTIERNCIIGIRSVVLDGAVVGRGSLIGAGAIVTPGMVIPPNSLVLGIPGKVKREDSSLEERALGNSEIYAELAKKYISGFF